MGRPRACIYYRRINKFSDAVDQRTDQRFWTQVAIVTFDWESAQPMATSDPPKLTATQIWDHPDGTKMTNEQTIHTQLRQAHDKRLTRLNTERTLLHSDLQKHTDDALIAFTTNQHGRVIQPGDGLMLVT